MPAACGSTNCAKADFEQQKTTVVDDLTTTSRSKGPRVGDNYNYTLKAGWAYALLRTSFSVDVEGGYRGNKRNGRLDYRESRFSQGTGDGEIGDYRSLDDYDNRETIGLGTVAVGHRFNDKGHELSASFYYKYGGGAVEYFQSDLFNLQGEREQGHRAWESEYRITARGNLDYVLPYSKTGKIEAGYQYYSYLEDSKYEMQFWNPETKRFTGATTFTILLISARTSIRSTRFCPRTCARWRSRPASGANIPTPACAVRSPGPAATNGVSRGFRRCTWDIVSRAATGCWFPIRGEPPARSFFTWSPILLSAITIRPRSAIPISVPNTSIRTN